MSEHSKALVSQPSLLDRSDSRVKHATGLGGTLAAFFDRIKSGDLGSLPVMVGLVIIWTVFASLNPVFLSANNLVNLLFDCATVGVISLGIVSVLMVGQIDLSVGSMSGFASAVVGTLWVNQGWPLLPAIGVALAIGCAIGALYALLFNRLGMPSFVATLAGLLAILGMQLYVLGTSGSINLPYGSAMVDFGQSMVIPAPVSHAMAVAPGLVILLVGLRTRVRRTAVRLSASSVSALVVRATLVTVLLQAIVVYLDRGRGVPLMFGVFLGLAVAMDYALTRTRWGRSMNAVGRATGFGQPAGRHRRREPECHRGCRHRGHQPVRRSRQRVFGGAGRDRHPVDRQRPHAAEPVLVAAFHDHRGRAGHRRDRRFARAPVAPLARPLVSRATLFPH